MVLLLVFGVGGGGRMRAGTWLVIELGILWVPLHFPSLYTSLLALFSFLFCRSWGGCTTLAVLKPARQCPPGLQLQPTLTELSQMLPT